MGETEENEQHEIFERFLQPELLSDGQLVQNHNQVAGHAGFYQLKDKPGICLKPFNIKCVRGRREHIFYQFVEYFKRSDGSIISKEMSSRGDQEQVTLYYEDFKLFTHPAKKCKCVMNSNVFNLLSPFMPKFYHVKHSNGAGCQDACIDQEEFRKLVYSAGTSCPCYGPNPLEKTSCSRDYTKINFLCLEDLTSHCRRPCILDIKIGQVTYDPMAVKEKVVEQSTKYRRLREFGFRILGMKLGEEFKDKTFGKAIETGEQVIQALDTFLRLLDTKRKRKIVVKRILDSLTSLLYWFEHINLGQLRFFSSSLLIVYDSYIDDLNGPLTEDEVDDVLVSSVRVSMIDFAHVFHVHRDSQKCDMSVRSSERDENYIYGLKKLISFYKAMDSRL